MRQTLNYLLLPVIDKGSIEHIKIDKEDVNKVLKYTWSLAYGYARTELENGKTIAMHRYLLGLPAGRVPEVDHINRDKLDNRKGNLRLATRRQNNINTIHKKSEGKNPYRGVYQVSQNSYNVVISSRGKRINVGSYKTAEQGAVAYNQAARVHHGDFAVLNEIPELQIL